MEKVRAVIRQASHKHVPASPSTRRGGWARSLAGCAGLAAFLLAAGAARAEEGPAAAAGVAAPEEAPGPEASAERPPREDAPSAVLDTVLMPPMVSAASRRTPLDLKKAIDRAVENNWNIRISRLDLRNAEINYDIAFSRMFVPNLTLSIDGISLGRTLGQVPGTAADASTRADYSSGYAAGTGATLSVGQFTLFNGWQDWQAFEMAKASVAFSREDYEDAVRQLKIDVINTFFSYKTAQDRLDTSKRSLEVAKAVRDLVKSKSEAQSGGEAGSTDFESSESDVLTAEKDVQEKERTMMFALWELNRVLGEPLGTPELVEDEIRFVPLRIDAEQAFRIYMEHSISEKKSRKTLREAEVNLASEERSRVPLPTVTFSGLQVGYHDTFFGGVNDGISSTSGLPTWEVSASVSFSIPLWNEYGFMNGRNIERARNDLEVAKITRLSNLVDGRNSIYRQVLSIRQLERSIELTQQQRDSAKEVQDSRFKQLSNETVSRVDLRDAILNAREAENALLEAKLAHLTAKLELAKKIGLASLPGDPFE